MRTAAEIKLLPAELGMVKTAMRSYSDWLEGWQKRQFDIAKERVENSNGNFEMDGMEMEYVCRALRKYGWLYYSIGKREKAKTYFELAQEIKEKKVQFQQKNNPLKKAVSA
ncbi:hypothetical protein [Fictibacillus gelatini]|uniref:hypothetical protein n=1 Tax=Fictibacillus gelatini TaxID=225985 RepID=UPI00040A2B51|nr:hypothetical protein [Fictibacillus gelatini]